MIKIIEPGTKTVAECNSCGCKFSYEKEDIQSRPHKTPDGCARQVLQNFQNYLSIMYCAHSVERILRLFQLKCREHKEE